MSFTAQEVIDLARDLWRESASGDILTDAQCYKWINRGVERVMALRTDACYDENGNHVESVTPVTGVASTIALNTRFLMACAYFLTANGYARSADLQNFKARFTEYMGLFANELRTA